MENDALNIESAIRLILFLGLFVLFAVAEAVWPRKALGGPKVSRWFGNLSITIGNTLLLRAIFIAIGLTAVGFSALMQEQSVGLLPALALPPLASFIIGFLLLDLAIYGQHVVMHHVPLLWRLHRMHHADTDIDVSTGLRFHPLEIVLSMGFKFVVIAASGISPFTVLIFEIVLNATSMFNHANMALPGAVDKILRIIVVTPDMHRVHHSIHAYEYNSNFGFNLPWWDRLFGTYRAQPVDGHKDMVIGLPEFREANWRQPGGLLRIPFVDDSENDQVQP